MSDISGQEATPESTPSAPAPRRRRAASRPAGAPPESSAPVEAPQTRVAAAVAPEEKAPAVVEHEPSAAPTRRRRATRAAGAPAPAPEPAPAKEQPQKAAEEPSATADQQADEAPKQPARRRRSRAASKTTKAAEPEEATQTSAPQAVASPEVGAEPGDDAEDPVEEDGIAAALRMAEIEASERKALIADPFSLTKESRQSALEELAAGIAEAPEDEDDEDSDDDDSDDDDSDDEDDSDDDSDEDDSDDDSDEDDSDDSDDDSEDDGDQRPVRRRRRRGGRRRRRGTGRSSEEPHDDSGDDNGDDGSDDASSEDESADDSSTDETDGTTGTRRRRRRRRRSGSGTGESTGTGDDEITGIEGSTRMEAKRQRRKENRAAGRRRAPILSEAEFLARRESVNRQMVIRQGEDYTQVAVMEDGILVEHYVDRANSTSLIGNVYLGKVQNVLPSMEAAFIDIGRGRNAVLYAGEVDWDHFGVTAEDRKVEKVFKSGQAVLVQVTKDPVGAKGARLTGHVSLPGRYVVYSPGGHLSGISRKLPDSERTRLREILGDLISDDESVIVRTAAEGVASEELVRDVNRLKAQWEVVEKKVKQGKAPQPLHSEPDLTLRIVRDLFTEDFSKLIVEGNGGQDDAWDSISAYVDHVAPHLTDRLEKFEPKEGDADDVFTKFRVDEHIAKALERKVYLPSGGSLVIDRTEAMTVVDVNTGRFTGAGGNLEATVTSNNLEAAEEIVRQIRLRDLGGIIVIDFIDMVLPSNRELLLRRLVECLGRDRTRHQVSEVTSLGLVQLTRKRIGTGLAEAFTVDCECCGGSGYHRSDEPVDSQAPSDGGDRRQGGNGRRRRGRQNG